MVCALCPSVFAVGRHFVAFPVPSLQVQLHEPPAQEVTRDVSGFRLARAKAPLFCSTKDSAFENGNARAAHALAPLLEHDDFTVRPDALVGLAKKMACNETATARACTCRYVGRL